MSADRIAMSPEHLEWIARFMLAAAAGGSSTPLAGELREACERLASDLAQPRVIRDSRGEPYLERHYILGGPLAGAAAFDERGGVLPGTAWRADPIGLYVHHLRASDEAAQLHSHPWEAAVSLILAGGYSEDRRQGERVVTRQVDPLELNVLRWDDFHRLDLLEQDAWSIFVTTRPLLRWSFWDPATGLESDAVHRRRGSGWRS